MRRVRYRVACSLDGFIAGPAGEFDWIVSDPTMDFAALYEEFDTFLMGRKTYELARQMPGAFRGKQVIVASQTLDPESNPGVEIVRDDLVERVERLRSAPGRDIWLFGGGVLFAYLLARNSVDTVELGIVPILLGDGVPFLHSPAVRRTLTFQKSRVLPSGIVAVEYGVNAPTENGQTNS